MTSNDWHQATREEDVRGVPAALRRQWKASLAALLLLLALGTAGAALYPSAWAATAVVSFAPRPGTSVDTVSLEAHRYAVVVTSDASVRRIAPVVPAATVPQIAEAIGAELETGTANLHITVRLPDRLRAVAAANAAARDLVAQAGGNTLVTSGVSAEATERAARLSPPRLLLEAAAVVAALMLAIVFGVLLDRVAALRSAMARGGASEPKNGSGTGIPAPVTDGHAAQPNELLPASSRTAVAPGQ